MVDLFLIMKEENSEGKLKEFVLLFEIKCIQSVVILCVQYSKEKRWGEI
jgi:hypothetical protein